MSTLVHQLGLGSVLIAASIAIQVLFIGLAMMVRPHLRRRIGRVRVELMMALIAATTLWFLIGQMVGVWLWASVFVWVGAFDAFEPALYFSLSAYTTLGFGDVLPPERWRILGALQGANGMIGFGLAAAALVDFVTRLRREA